MVTSLIKYERIETTKAKAKEIRRTAEKLVTRAKVDSVHNRRIAAKTIYEKDMVNKLFTVVGPRFTERPGGYTRMLKLGRRTGDAAEMVILEFLKDEEGSSAKKAPARKKSTAKSESSKAAAPKAGSKTSAGSKKTTTAKEKAAASTEEDSVKTSAAESEKPAAKPEKPAETPVDEGPKSEAESSDESSEPEKPAE